MAEAAELLAAARAARAHAYAPYSGFAVGAAVRAESGRIYAACNVENAAYPVGTCAEAGAIAAMVAAGERRVVEALVVAESPQPVTPCGACRQRLREFADDATPVHIAGRAGVVVTLTLATLLPHSFGPQHLPNAIREIDP
ncbi:MAG: cytidine deaminase [Hyphomicrobiales bacterium]|nr:cytidine deaminase [Hyphomicrobiales bacterium]